MIIVSHKGNRQYVPCGKCAFCLMNKRSSWMFRIHHEMKDQMYPGYFLTLTYSERFVRRVNGKLSLYFRHIQLFLKKLRKRKRYCKYICVGEYGSETYRPHYHMMLWTDATTDELESCWSTASGVSLGAIHFGTLTMASAMYTLKYIIQPKPPVYEGVQRPRAQFSRGLGLSYLTTEVYEFHTDDYDSPVFYSYIDGAKVALPRYFRGKIFTKFQTRKNSHTIKWRSIKERRKLMRALLKQGIKNTKTYIQMVRTEQAKLIIANTKFNQSI